MNKHIRSKLDAVESEDEKLFYVMLCDKIDTVQRHKQLLQENISNILKLMFPHLPSLEEIFFILHGLPDMDWKIFHEIFELEHEIECAKRILLEGHLDRRDLELELQDAKDLAAYQISNLKNLMKERPINCRMISDIMESAQRTINRILFLETILE